MPIVSCDVDLAKVDLASLKSDDDYDKEAERLMPSMIRTMADEVAERSWNDMVKMLKKASRKIGTFKTTNSEKQKFLREARSEFESTMTAAERNDFKQQIVEELKRAKQPPK